MPLEGVAYCTVEHITDLSLPPSRSCSNTGVREVFLRTGNAYCTLIVQCISAYQEFKENFPFEHNRFPKTILSQHSNKENVDVSTHTRHP